MLLEHVPLAIEVVPDARGVLMSVAGDLDAATAADLLSAGERLILDGQRHLAIDCARLTFCDSYGLRAMVALANRLEPVGSVTIRRESATLRRLLDLTGLRPCFEPAA